MINLVSGLANLTMGDMEWAGRHDEDIEGVERLLCSNIMSALTVIQPPARKKSWLAGRWTSKAGSRVSGVVAAIKRTPPPL